MKRLTLLALLSLFYTFLPAQSIPTSTIEVKLYLPAHISTVPGPGTKLEVYFLGFISDSSAPRIPKKTVARKIRENIYSFEMPKTKLWHIGFSYGQFSSRMMCVNNTDGEAAERYDFTILFAPGKTDFSNIRFLPPCLNNDEE